jgi:hypothetical protein
MPLQSRLAEKAEYWNEDELKFFFIGPIVTIFSFNELPKILGILQFIGGQ